jgi:RNA 3'-terminal phosphate cyclase-like protein
MAREREREADTTAVQGGYVDSANQAMMLLFMVLCTENVSKIRLGRLTDHTYEPGLCTFRTLTLSFAHSLTDSLALLTLAYSIQMLRHIRDVFGTRFKITSGSGSGSENENESVILACMGIGYKNLARKVW